jgi:hypothetical protein
MRRLLIDMRKYSPGAAARHRLSDHKFSNQAQSSGNSTLFDSFLLVGEPDRCLRIAWAAASTRRHCRLLCSVAGARLAESGIGGPRR